MWEYTGVEEPGPVADTVLREVASNAEGVAWHVLRRGDVVGRVQRYDATVEAGRGVVHHGPTWAFTPLGAALVGGRRRTSLGRATFGFASRDDATLHGLRQAFELTGATR